MSNWKKIFLTIWSGQAFSLLTSALVQFAIVWWMTKETGSASVLAFATLMALLPQIVLGPFIGVWIDRLNRKTIMIAADSFIALCSVIVAILYHFNAIEMWHVYILLMFRSIGSAFHMPSMQASVPLLAPEEQLTRIAGINQVLQSVANIAGPALGAMLITVFSMEIVMLTDVIGAAIACITLAFVKIPQPKPHTDTTGKSVIHDMFIAFKALHTNKGLFTLVMLFVICMFVYMPLNAFYPLMTFNHFKGGAVEMGIVEAAFGIGMLIGGGLIGIFGVKKHKVKLINMSYLIIGIALVITCFLSPSQFHIFVVSIAIFGLAIPFFNSPLMAIIQMQIDPSMLGRVFSLFGTLTTLPSAISLMGAGIIADNIGITNAFGVAGILIVLLGIVGFMLPALRQLEKQTEQ